MEIKPATLDDVPQLVQLVNSAYRGETAKQGWTTEADLLDGIRTDEEALAQLVATPGSVILKSAGAAGELTGCVFLKKQQEQLYLGMLTVQPKLQAKGIGKKLLAAAEAHGRVEGCRRIAITVISVRHELIRWYERHGFRKTGETEPFPSDPRFGIPRQPLEFVVMEKDIL
ncbi:GNAT family N-acetyltransferase [Paraflavisolibacter sp. H34]|uniref:GNAT family N-acetyltransferase n=1 Tax=Huijunlia imazamoxiresistens TaxID=3127457 RepID=UPI003016FE17